jgi:hypothetical protein
MQFMQKKNSTDSAFGWHGNQCFSWNEIICTDLIEEQPLASSIIIGQNISFEM